MTALAPDVSVVPTVIDLRQPDHLGDTAASERDRAARLQGRRRAIVAVAMALVALVVWDFVAGRVIHDQRQRHLANEVITPAVKVGDGDALMILQIPQLGVNTVVVEGSSSGDLRSGLGHVAGSATPGDGNNIVVAGRRTRYAGSFGDLDTLRVGSQITVQTRSGLIRQYTVSSTSTVPSTSKVPLASSKDERLTLVTAAPGLFPDRLRMVSATLTAGAKAAPAKGFKFQPAADALDLRPVGSLVGGVALLLVLGLIVLAIWLGGGELRRRYSPLTVAGVLVPIVGLLSVLVIFSLDALLPAVV